MTTDPTTADDALADLLRRAHRELPDAPAPWVQAATALWVSSVASAVAAPAPLAGLAQGLQQAWREITAVLRFDSAVQSTLAMGMRGSASAATRQLLFSAEGHDIDLRIAPLAGGAFSVTGQVLGPETDCTIALAPEAGGVPSREVRLDDLGEFQLDDVAAGRWMLRLSLPDQVIALPAIELGGAAPSA